MAFGQEALWRRVRSEVDADGKAAWGAVHGGRTEPELTDIFQLLLVTVPMYQVNYNRFVFEAAQIPPFARFLRKAPGSLCDYVSNPIYGDPIAPEPYSDAAMRKLGEIVNRTLGQDNEEWFLG